MENIQAWGLLGKMLSQAVQKEALLTGDCSALHVVRPRANVEQTAFGTGIESLP